jgi:2-methylisocitrate lyase-like PEP mutase family enzyme
MAHVSASPRDQKRLRKAALRSYDARISSNAEESIMETIPQAVVAAANQKSNRLRELVRAPEILVMPGAFDVLSARLFEHMGFQAVQGTSGGIAAVLGYPDGEAMSRDLFIASSGALAAAVRVPFNADGERGYGDETGVRETVRALIARGVAGMNLEDGAAKGKGGLVPLDEQLRKIKAVMETKNELGSDFFLNARVDAFHVITDDLNKATAQAIERSNAYAEAGADCIFYLFLHSAEIIGRLAKEVAAPISILAGPQSPSVQQLENLGVARVSYGSGFTKAAITEVKRLAQEIQQNGTCNLLKNAMQTAELAALAARSTSVV